MRKKGIIFLGSTAIMAVSILAGCGGSGNTDQGNNHTESSTIDANAEISADELAKTASEKLKEVKSYSFKTETKMDYTMSANGDKMDMKMDGIISGESVIDSKESHLKIDYNASALDQDLKMDNEAYIISENDGSFVSYSKSNGNTESGKWIKSETKNNIDLESMKNSDIIDQIANGKIEASIADGSYKVNDKDVYKLEATIPGEIFEEVYSNMYGGAQTSDAFSGADFSQIKAKTEIYIYKDSMLPARTYMDIKEYGEALIQQVIDNASTTQEVETSFGDFFVDMTINDYNQIDDIVIPDEVLKEAGE